MITAVAEDEKLLQTALELARDTRQLLLGHGVRRQSADLFGKLFGSAPAMIVADDTTFDLSGRDVFNALRANGQMCQDPFVFGSDGLYADYPSVERLCDTMAASDAIPIAVGGGTINDLTKLAAHQCGRRYIAVATAASMDGYTAFGASITHEGSKQTFACPAPLGVVADLDVIVDAPPEMNAAGYADLVAKSPAGADWILADALGVEPIEPAVWRLAQSRLRGWMEDPAGIRAGNAEAVRRLTVALMMSGFAMQAACSSRPASGAEHQFSHLWDMEHHQVNGLAPSHGFKVGIGTLASLALYDVLLNTGLDTLDVAAAVDAWPARAANDEEVNRLFPEQLAAKVRAESAAKHVDVEALRAQLTKLKSEWPAILQRLAHQIIHHSEVRDMLRAAGCPYESKQIGISNQRLRSSYRKAYHIRRRFTILDVIRRANLWDAALDRIFATTESE